MKQEFEFQFFIKRWLMGMPILLVAGVLEWLLHFLPMKPFVFYILCVAIMLVLETIYYVETEKRIKEK